MKTQIIDFINHLLIYDYFLFGGIILLFIVLLVLAIILRHKMGLAIMLVLLAFIILTAGPIGGYIVLHNYLFKHTLLIHDVKALEFTEALLIKGDINNTSKRPFNECTFHAGVFKVTHNQYLDKLYPYVPFKKSSTTLKREIKPGESAPFKLFVEPFRYSKDFNVTLKADCR